jgi:hypothetical protein
MTHKIGPRHSEPLCSSFAGSGVGIVRDLSPANASRGEESHDGCIILRFPKDPEQNGDQDAHDRASQRL